MRGWVGFEFGLGFVIVTGLRQKLPNCEFAISKLRGAFCKLRRLTTHAMYILK